MKKIIVTAILASFIITSCSFNNKIEKEVIKTESSGMVSDQTNNSDEVSYFTASDMQVDTNGLIGIQDNQIYRYNFDAQYNTSWNNLESDNNSQFNNGMIYINQIKNIEDEIWVYGFNKDHDYFVDTYDLSLNSYKTILNCSELEECDNQYFDDVCFGNNRKIYTVINNGTDIFLNVFSEDGNNEKSLCANELMGSGSDCVIQSSQYVTDGYFCVLAEISSEKYVYIFDDQLNYISKINLDFMIRPEKIVEVDGAPVISAFDNEDGRLSFYSLNVADGNADHITILQNCDKLLNMIDASSIGYLKNGSIYSFDIKTSKTSLVKQNADTAVSNLFSSNDSICCINNNENLSATISVTDLNHSIISEYNVSSDQNILMVYWIRLLSSGKIQLVAEEENNNSSYVFYEIDMDKQTSTRSCITYDDECVSGALITENAYLYNVNSGESQAVCFYDLNGKEIFRKEFEDQEIVDMICSYDESPVFQINDNAKEKSVTILSKYNNVNSWNETTDITIDDDNGVRIFSGNEIYDIFLVNDDGVYGIDFETKTKKMLIDFNKTDLPQNIIIYGYNYISEELSYIITEDTVYKLTACKKDPQNAGEKSDNVLDIGCINTQPEDFMIKYFESKYPDYKVNIINYSTDIPEFQSEFDKAFLTDNTPDMIYFCGGDYYDPTVHNGKNAYVDLNKLMKDDNELSRDDLKENIISALEYNGSLYQITPFFTLQTIFTDSEELIDKTGWTTEEFLSYYNSHSSSAFYDNARTISHISECLQPFIDYSGRKASFLSKPFMDLTSLARKSSEDESLNDDFTLYDTYIIDFNQLNMVENAVFGGRRTQSVGFPGIQGNGSLIISGQEFSILSESDNIDAAWKFIKCYFTQEYMDNNMAVAFPVKKDLLESLKEKTRTVNTDPNNTKYGAVLDAYDIKKNYVKLQVPDDGMLDRTMDIIDNACQLYKPDCSIQNIYYEEYFRYINNEVSIDEMCSALQKRTEIYLGERY